MLLGSSFSWFVADDSWFSFFAVFLGSCFLVLHFLGSWPVIFGSSFFAVFLGS